MSSEIEIKLSEDEYNAVFTVVSAISGTYSKVAASKALELIRSEVQAGLVDQVPPDTITVSFPRKILDGVFLGITEKAKDEKVTCRDILHLKTISTLLKMKVRFEKFADAELEKMPDNEDLFDFEVFEGEFDD